MDYTKATDNQLWTILNHDNDCPRSLLGEVAVEMLNRNLFDNLIAHAMHHVMNIGTVERLYQMGHEDFMQIGRLIAFIKINEFKSGKGKKFTSFLYMVVKNEFIKKIVALGAGKRDSSKNISYHNEMEDGSQFEIFLHDNKTNVEKYVINKLHLQELLKRANSHQKTVIYYHLQGYTFKEISEMLGTGSASTTHESYKLAIQKMRRGA